LEVTPSFFGLRALADCGLDLRDVDGLTCPTTQSRILSAMAYALAASRHAHQYGTIGEQLAVVAVATLEWVLLNLAAWGKSR
jgi:acetyl-CoA acetyltransferase